MYAIQPQSPRQIVALAGIHSFSLHYWFAGRTLFPRKKCCTGNTIFPIDLDFDEPQRAPVSKKFADTPENRRIAGAVAQLWLRAPFESSYKDMENQFSAMELKFDGRRLKIDHKYVKDWLTFAQEKGFLSISLGTAAQSREASLIDKYKCLKQVKLVPASADYSALLRDLGKVAADWLTTTVRQRAPIRPLGIGVTGGETIYSVAEAVSESPLNISIFPLTVSCRNEFTVPVTYDAPYVAMALFWKTKGRIHGSGGSTAHISAVPSLKGISKGERNFYKSLYDSSKDVQHVLGRAENADILFVGTHSLPNAERDPVFGAYRLFGMPSDALEKVNAVGGINYSFMDAAGRYLGPSDLGIALDENSKLGKDLLHEFLLALNLDYLCRNAADKAKSVVLVSGGAMKQHVTLAAIRAGLANVLITDEQTASFLLDSPLPTPGPVVQTTTAGLDAPAGTRESAAKPSSGTKLKTSTRRAS